MSTNQFRRYLDLLNEAETTSRLIANQPFIPGQPLSTVQMAAVDLAKRMGNNIPPDVQQAYDLAKQAGITPGPGVTTNNRSETSNILKNLIKPRSDSGNYIDPKTGIIMYIPSKSPKAGFDAPDPDPKPLTLKLLNQPEAQEIKNALRAAGLEIISVDKPSLFGSYPVAAVDPNKLAQALAATGSNNVKEIPYSELVPPNDALALPSSGSTFSNDDALAAALAKQQAGGGKSGGAEDGPGLAGGQRCAVCGTPKMAHSDLKHQFQPGGDTRPDPVPQGPAGGDDNLSRISRVKDLQRALLAAGADLGKTGASRNGIDGDIGPLTRAAMQKYPDIAAKYADLPAGQDSTPAGKSGNIEKLNAALTAIEGILAKYKVKLSEDRESSTPTDQMRQWRSLMELTQADMDAAAAKRKTAQGANQSAIDARVAADAKAKKIGPYYSDTPAKAMPYSQAAQQAAQTASTGAAGQGAAAATTATGQGAAAATTATGKGALRGAATIAGKAAGRVLPGAGALLGAQDAYDRATKGDYTGAGISGLAGIASLFPGLGTAASLGLLGLNVYLDSNKTPTVAITADDAKIIADNVKIIQDWQKDPANQAALTPELKNRIANVLKGVSTLGVPTAQAATPATPAQPATTPAAPTANPKVDQINQTLNSMDQLLKKNKFESANNKKSPPLTESERMARLRDIVTEDVTDYVLPTVGAAATGYGAYHGGRALEKGASKTKAFYIALRAVLKLATKAVTSMGKVGLLVGTGILLKGLYDFAMADPQAVADAGINAQDIEEFNRLNEQLKQLIGDNKNFDTLPPDTQQKIKAMHQRIIDMTAKIINQEAGGQK